MKKVILHLLILTVISPAIAGSNLNSTFGPSWDCHNLDVRLPEEFINKCFECQTNGQDFIQDSDRIDFEHAVGHCQSKEGGSLRDKLRKALKAQSQTAPSKKSKPQNFAIACGKYITPDKKHNAVACNLGGPHGTMAEAEVNAQVACDRYLKEHGFPEICKVVIEWRHGCGYAAANGPNGGSLTPDQMARQSYFWGTNKAAVLAQCNASDLGTGQCDVLGACVE